jgi:hypothetical protein
MPGRLPAGRSDPENVCGVWVSKESFLLKKRDSRPSVLPGSRSQSKQGANPEKNLPIGRSF